MKKKHIMVADQIITIEKKLQNNENFNENMDKLDDIIASLSLEEFYEINDYIENKLGKGILEIK